MEQFEQKSDRVIAMTEYYLARFGKAWLGIYYLPVLSENWRFTVFINSLLITLRRMDLMPVYCWFMEDNGGHYLFLCINGYFRNDLSDVTPNSTNFGGFTVHYRQQRLMRFSFPVNHKLSPIPN